MHFQSGVDTNANVNCPIASETRDRQEDRMDLPVLKEIKTSSDRELIMEIVERLQGNGIEITPDVLAAIKMTLEMSEGVVE